jgi:6-phosphogluconate dehydrogenase
VSIYSRFASRGQADFADKLLSAMRKEFGGHDEKTDQTIGTTS